MYVCVCLAVTENQIHDAARQGIACLGELRERLGVTGECGRCTACARQCLDLAKAWQAHRPGQPAPRLLSGL